LGKQRLTIEKHSHKTTSALSRAALRLLNSRPDEVTAEIVIPRKVKNSESSYRCWVIQVRQIRQLQLEDNYTQIYFENESALVLRSLAALEKRLPSKLFFRANRTQILNLSCIEGVVPWFNNGLKVKLHGAKHPLYCIIGKSYELSFSSARREFRAVA
jgi:DNA-binding LytR/AlgR family response regulator